MVKFFDDYPPLSVDANQTGFPELENPEGLLGDIAEYFYESAPRPSKLISIAGAIGFFAGIVGRGYNISGTGLNQYILVLAPTGSGKEAMASGIDRLIVEIRKQVPAVSDFMGPAEIASGPALLKYLGKTRHVSSAS